MCLIAFAWQAHADYPLVVAGNRDEFYARPTAAADWWPDGRCLAGRDLRAGGTWMGVTRGRFGALTNHRAPQAVHAAAPSRGALVGDVLAAPTGVAAALERIAGTAARYNGFNLLAAEWLADASERGRMWIVSSPGDARPRPVAPGVHGLSNARLDTPWPKVARARAALRAALDETSSVDALIDRLFAMLADRAIADDRDLPATGVSRDVERSLSATFIRMPGYGTRASTAVVVERSGAVTFVERSCEPEQPVDERRFAFGGGGTESALSATRGP